MNITRENIGELNEILTVRLNPSDYKEKVEKSIKDQSKKVKLPGFRPGTVPTAHIRKLYGKSILVEEVNHLLSHSLNHYLEENQLELLGQPLPIMDSEHEPKWEEEEDFEFKYEIGLAPNLDVSQIPNNPLIVYQIKAEPETIESRIQNLRRAYGKMTNPEISEKGDVLYLDLMELDTQGESLSNGIQKKTSLRTDLVQNEKILNQILGLKKGDKGKIALGEAFNLDPHPLGHVLEISEEEAAQIKSEFSFEVLNINRLNPSDLDEAFFLKLFPDGTVMNEDEFRLRIISEIEERMKELSDKRMESDIIHLSVKHFTSVLPHQFLRKWLLSRKDERYTEENIAESYPEFERNLKWSLISNQIALSNDIKVEPTEIVEEAKNRLKIQFRMYSPEPIQEDELNEYSMKLLQNREQVSQLYEDLRSKKVLNLLKSQLNIQEKEIGYEDFLKLS